MRVWRLFKKWLLASTGDIRMKAWPYTPAEVIEYLEMRRAEPCMRSVPASIVAGLHTLSVLAKWIPRAAQVRREQSSGQRRTWL